MNCFSRKWITFWICLYILFVGRALEELRSSLYNELKTSEGAKRQQQRFCGPVVAMSFNFVVAVGIILANKLVKLTSLNLKFFLCLCVIIKLCVFAGDGKSWIQFPNLSNAHSLCRCLDSSSFLQISLVASYVSSIKDHTFLLSFLSWSCHGLCFWSRQYQPQTQQVHSSRLDLLIDLKLCFLPLSDTWKLLFLSVQCWILPDG